MLPILVNDVVAKKEATRVPLESKSINPPFVALFIANVVYPAYVAGEVVPIPTFPDAVAKNADCVTRAVPATCKRSPVFVVVPNSVFAAK